VVAVIGGDGRGNLVSATRVDGHSSGVPRLCRGRARAGAGTNIPTARNRLLRNGPELGNAGFAKTPVSRPSAGCSWPALPAGFGISRFWVRRLLDQRGGIGTASACCACQTESR
jgi:hypothetical protein